MVETVLMFCDWCGRERTFPPDFACSKGDSPIWGFHKLQPTTEALCKAMIEQHAQVKPTPGPVTSGIVRTGLYPFMRKPD